MMSQPKSLEKVLRRSACFAVLVLGGLAQLTSVARGQSLTEFALPRAGIFLRGIAAGPDGNLWFTENEVGIGSIGRITAAGNITEFRLPTQPESSHTGIAAGPDGNVWFTETGKIGRITTAGAVTEFPIPTADIAASDIAVGPDGNLWFTERDTRYSVAQTRTGIGKIGRITTAGVITEFPIPTVGSYPQGIAAGPDGNLWFTEYELIPAPPSVYPLPPAFAAKIGRITVAGDITVFPIPSSSSGLDQIAAGPDGNLWFTEAYPASNIGRITTSGMVTEFLVPFGSVECCIAAAPDGNLWFTEADRIGRITTTGVVAEYSLPTGHHPSSIAVGRDGHLWFTEAVGFLTEKIGRLNLSATACTPTATNLCLNNSRFKVEAAWTAPDGATGAGQAVTLTAESGYFWFFSPNNVELIVKVLYGCSFNNNHWVFAAGLTNVNVVLKVTDTQTGQVKTYVNPQGTVFQPIQDTSAFPCQ